MPSQIKTIALIKAEGNKRHLTKAEIEHRENAEAALLTGITIKELPEVKAHPAAHKEFRRIKKLLESIGKNDDLYGNTINMYCLLVAECKDYELMKVQLHKDVDALQAARDNGEMETIEYLDRKGQLQNQILACDKRIMQKRKMIFDISKENIMTIQAALRSIPMKPKKEDEPSPMERLLTGRMPVK